MSMLPVGLFETDLAGRLVSADESFRALAMSGGALPIGSAPWANAHPGDRAAAELAWRRLREAGEPLSATFRVWTSEGKLVWLRLDTTPKRDLFGQHTGYLGCVTDITEEQHQRQLSERLTGLLEASPDAVLIIDRHGSPTFTNEAARALFGVTNAVDLVREPAMRTLLQTLRDQIPREVLGNTKSGEWNGEAAYRGPDGLSRTLNVTVYVQRAPDGAIEFWAGQIRDITTSKQLQAELAHQATHDALTGLPNRTLLLRTLADALERARFQRQQVAVLFLDLDRLKDVNDNSGHDVGDLLLASIAGRLASATRPADVIARIGGDEFVVLCEGGIDEQAAIEVAERVRTSLTGRLMLNGVEVDISVSIGVALSNPTHPLEVTAAEEAVALVRNADTAMYRAKRRGRSRCELFTDEMLLAARERKQLSTALEQAIAADQLRLAYQPIVSTHTGRMVGAEALLRWNHPQHGLLMPSDFVQLAEETGAIVPMGDWVIHQACRDARAWIDAGLVERSFSVHVNVSGRQMSEGAFVERVIATVRELDLLPQQLTLDFDENTLYGDQPTTMRALQTLRRFGVSIALDSFGSGVSSLTALRDYRADVLKLDGSIASGLGSDADSDPILRSIIQLAHALDMEVVAEWVTAPDQLYRLKVLGCDMAQGYLFGEPCAADTFAESARAHRS
jgi:diguanylate cyclase (GGDEF)-like protein/PAS domain S-box-containing protein